MLNLQEIENTIQALENGSTTFDTCFKLASLYIVRNKVKEQLQEVVDTVPEDAVTEELEDILPAYTRYVDAKGRYQQNELQIEAVIKEAKTVCQELGELIDTFYQTSECAECRNLITGTIRGLYNKYCN